LVKLATSSVVRFYCGRSADGDSEGSESSHVRWDQHPPTRSPDAELARLDLLTEALRRDVDSLGRYR